MSTINNPNEKALGGHSEGFKGTTNNHNGSATQPQPKRKFSVKSTATEAQYSRIVMMLESGPKNTIEFRRAGIMSPASRIKELNDRHGFDIPTIDRITVFDDDGFAHVRVAVYEMVSKPDIEVAS